MYPGKFAACLLQKKVCKRVSHRGFEIKGWMEYATITTSLTFAAPQLFWWAPTIWQYWMISFFLVLLCKARSKSSNQTIESQVKSYQLIVPSCTRKKVSSRVNSTVLAGLAQQHVDRFQSSMSLQQPEFTNYKANLAETLAIIQS